MAMNFRKQRLEDPEINLIPFIDVLLVVLIFLMLSTTYSKFTELQITLPVADADKPRDNLREIIIAVSNDGRFSVNRKPVDGRSVVCAAVGVCRDRPVANSPPMPKVTARQRIG